MPHRATGGRAGYCLSLYRTKKKANHVRGGGGGGRYVGGVRNLSWKGGPHYPARTGHLFLRPSGALLPITSAGGVRKEQEESEKRTRHKFPKGLQLDRLLDDDRGSSLCELFQLFGQTIPCHTNNRPRVSQ
jgi:hypothetical protein